MIVEGSPAVPAAGGAPVDQSVLLQVSGAMVRLHKEQFGRGPRRARCTFAGPDTLTCVLEDVLLPAERSMLDMGLADRVIEARTFLQVATRDVLVGEVEQLVGRRVRAFASAVDAEADVVFENFVFEARDDDAAGTAADPD